MAEGQSPTPFHVTPPPPLKLGDDKAEEWKLFCQIWDNYAIITDLKKRKKPYQRAVFLNTIGTEGLRLVNTLVFETKPDGTQEDKNDVDLLITKLTSLIVGQTNETYERFIFNKRDQRPDESVDEYIRTLKELSKTCNFCDCLRDSLIRDRLVLGIKDHPTRKVLLQRRKLTLAQAEDICRSNEATASQLKELGEDPTIHATRPKGNATRPKGNLDWKKKEHMRERTEDIIITCKFCGRKHRRDKRDCPAIGKTCAKCGRINHFANCCHTRKSVKAVVEEQESDHSGTETETDSVDSVEEVYTTKQGKGALFTEMTVNDIPVRFQIDSGATVNVIPQKYLHTDSDLKPDSVKLKMYNNTTLEAKGRTKLKLRNPKNGKKYRVHFIVVSEDNLTPLLSRKAAEQMKLITVNYDNFNQLHGVDGSRKPEDPLSEPRNTQDVFDDTSPGKLQGTVHLVTDMPEGTKPVQCSAKPVPVALKEKVKDGLQKLVDRDVINTLSMGEDKITSLQSHTRRKRPQR